MVHKYWLPQYEENPGFKALYIAFDKVSALSKGNLGCPCTVRFLNL